MYSRSTSATANPAKRLWHTLVMKEQLQKIFLDFAFSQNTFKADKSTGVVSIQRNLVSFITEKMFIYKKFFGPLTDGRDRQP